MATQASPRSPTHIDYATGAAPDGTATSKNPLAGQPRPSIGIRPATGDRPFSAAATPATTDNDTDTDTTATNSSDEFDWSDEGEDAKKRDPTRKAKRGRRLWLLFTKLSRFVRVMLSAVFFGGLFVTPALLFIFVFPGSKVRPHVVPWSLWIAISWGVGCFMTLLVDLIPHFLLFVITTCFGKAPESLKTQLELFISVSFWIKLALDVSAAWIALAVIRPILDPPGKYWSEVNRVMQALFSAVIIFLVEKLFVHIVAIRFHQKALADRISENRIALKALDKLSTATPQVSMKKKKRKTPGGSLDAKDALTMSAPASRAPSPGPSRSNTPDLLGKSRKAGKQSGTATPARGQKKKKISSKAMAGALVDQLVDLKEAIGQVALKDSKLHRKGEIGSLYSARRLARQLFSTLSSVYPPRKHLIVDDFYPYFRTEADAQVAFRQFDQDDNGDISRKEMREAVQRIYRERKSLSASLKDMSSAVSRLDGVMSGVAMIIIIFLCLLIFNNSGDVSSLVPLATIVLGFSFVFGNSARTMFESLIFIFSTHVYDVGDLVIIDDQVLTVTEFGLFATTFRRVDGQEVVAPNSILATQKLIHNVRRSGPMWETTELHISYSTPLEIVEQLKTKLRAYMAANNREWASPGVEIWIDKMKFQNAIHLTIAVEHRHNWQDWGGRWNRRGLFMKHLKTVLEELEIGYQMPLQPVTFHPSSAPPPWVTRGDGVHAGGTQDSLMGGGGPGFMDRDPIRSMGMPAPRAPRFTLDRGS